MTTRNIDYENKFKTYLYNGSLDRYRAICKNIGVKSSQEGESKTKIPRRN